MSPPARLYLYCIGHCDLGVSSLPPGIAEHKVSLVAYEDLAAYVSDCPVEKVAIARENMLTHQGVMEAAMQAETILPVRFSTVAEPKNGYGPEALVVEKVLKGRRREMQGLLQENAGMVELGLKATWTNIEEVFLDIAEKDRQVRQYRAQALATPQGRNRDEMVALGRAVQTALLERKKAEGERLVKPLMKIARDGRINKNYGDRMLLNAAFLVRKDRQGAFREQVEALAREGENRGIRLSFAGPLPISNFVEIVVVWD